MVAEEHDRQSPRLTILPTETFLRQHGVAPGDIAFTPDLLRSELQQRGWQVDVALDRVNARKALPGGGISTVTALAVEGDTLAALETALSDAIHLDGAALLAASESIAAHIMAQAPDGHVVLLVEVRAGSAIGLKHAQHIRQTLTTHSTVYGVAPYFMLATLGEVFLWDQRSPVPPSGLPALTTPVAPLLATYLPWLQPGEFPGRTTLQLVIRRWLSDLANPKANTAPLGDEIEHTGLLEALRNSDIVLDAPI